MWLYVPEDYMDCRCAAELVDSNSDSPSPARDIELCVFVSGTPTQRPLSWHAWKNRPWIKRLYGTISEPLMANRGAGKWILSLPACRVSHIHARANEKDGKTSGAQKSSPILSESCESVRRRSSSEKTCQSLLIRDIFGPCEMSYEEWVTKSRGRSLSLQKALEQRNAGKEYSGWPTVTTNSATYANGQRGENLIEAAAKFTKKMWATLQARDYRGGIAKRLERDQQQSVNDQATHLTAFFLRTNPELMNGIESLPKTLNLRPAFAEWLMGWPQEWTACDAAVTGLSRYKRRMRSELCALMQE